MKKLLINLQLFADYNADVNGTYSNTLGNNLSAENKTFYDKSLIVEASAELVHDQFGQKRPIPKNGGKKIEFRKFASLPKATTALTEGVTPKGNKLDVTTVEANVLQYGDYITQTDVLELTSIDNTIVEATKVLGNQAGRTLDTVTRDILHSGSNVYFAPKADGTVVTKRSELDDTCLLTGEDVKNIAAILKANNAPKIDGSYVAIIHPYVAKDLMNDDWVDINKYSNTSAIYEGEIGKLYGVRFVESTEAMIYGDGDAGTEDAGVFGTLFLGANAYGVTEIEGGGLQTIIKQKGSAGTSDPLDQRSSIGWKAMKTAEILIPAYIVRAESKSSFSAKAKAN